MVLNDPQYDFLIMPGLEKVFAFGNLVPDIVTDVVLYQSKRSPYAATGLRVLECLPVGIGHADANGEEVVDVVEAVAECLLVHVVGWGFRFRCGVASWAISFVL